MALMLLLAQANAVHIPLPDESVQCVTTSPPYWGLRDYQLPPLVWGGNLTCEHEWGIEQIVPCGNTPSAKSTLNDGKGPQEGDKYHHSRASNASQGQFCQLCSAWHGSLGLESDPESYVRHLVEVFREVRRVLRDDGTVWLNLGSSYWGGKGKSGHTNPEYQATRVASGESFSQVAAHVGGRGKIRPSDGSHPVFKPKDLVPIPWMVAMALQQDGWWLRSEITWCKKAPMPESVRDRPSSATEKIFLLAKSKSYYYDQDAARVVHKQSSLERYEYSWHGKDSGFHRDARTGSSFQKMREGAKMKEMINPAGRNLWNYWVLGPEPYKGSHFAVFPSSIPEIAIRAGTSERGCCPECGAAWKRIVKKGRNIHPGSSHDHTRDAEQGNTQMRADGVPAGTIMAQRWYARVSDETLGWRPTCTCQGKPERGPVRCTKCGGTGKESRCQPAARSEAIGLVSHQSSPVSEAVKVETGNPCPRCDGIGYVEGDIWPDDIDDWPTVPCVVLDPFVGSGTTLLVARKLGRRSVGLDLSYSYLHDQAQERLGLRALTEWESGKPDVAEQGLEELPLFAETGRK